MGGARILVIGYGNPLRGDDGAGFEAAERLRGTIADPDVEVLAVHQLMPELMEPASAARRVIFIDAATGSEPGEIRERPVEATAPSNASFTHHLTPESLLAGARALYGRAPEAWLISIGGADFSCTMELSETVSQRIDTLIAAVERRAKSVIFDA